MRELGVIVVDISDQLAKNEMTVAGLADRTGLDEKKLSKLIIGDVSAVRLTSLASICDALNCMPGDILKYVS